MTSRVSPPLALTGDDVAVFASDTHLGGHDDATADLFLRTLAGEARSATHVFLLGDVFDAWVGDDDPDVYFEHLATLLARFSNDGRQVFVMRGNRDFLLDVASPASPARFAASSGARMIDDPTVIDLFGTRTLIAHGDALCTDDHDYQRFRTMVRNEAWQREFLSRPLEIREGIARDIRARSELSKAEKIEYEMDVNQGAVEAAMRAAGVHCLIHGHTHRPAPHAFVLDGHPAHRWVLPDWDAAGKRGGVIRANRAGLVFSGLVANR